MKNLLPSQAGLQLEAVPKSPLTPYKPNVPAYVRNHCLPMDGKLFHLQILSTSRYFLTCIGENWSKEFKCLNDVSEYIRNLPDSEDSTLTVVDSHGAVIKSKRFDGMSTLEDI
jgi:hypothetical protein